MVNIDDAVISTNKSPHNQPNLITDSSTQNLISNQSPGTDSSSGLEILTGLQMGV